MDKFLSILPPLLQGTGLTLTIFFWVLIFSIPLGLIICLMRMSKIKPIKWFAQGYILLFRGTPLMLQLLFFFLGLPLLGIKLDRMTAAVLSFIFNYAAYFGEIFRGGVQSIPRGQYEASQVLGLSRTQCFLKIILPQVVRRVIPPMGNEVVTLVKDTALVYAIALSELLRQAQILMITQNNLNAFITAAVFYLIMTSILTFAFNKIEKRLSYYKI